MAKHTDTARQAAFLAAYAECGNLTIAAQIAGTALRSHYNWLRNPEYRERWGEARDNAVDLLAAEARRRALDGVEEVVIYGGQLCYPMLPSGKRSTKPLTIRRYDSNLLMFLMKSMKPEVYRDHWRGEVNSTTRISVPSPKLDLSRLSDQEFEQLARLVDIATVGAPIENKPDL